MKIKGIAFALLACLLWGLIFVVPGYCEEFSCLEVALGRYFFFGLFSLSIFVKGRLQGGFRYPLFIWKKLVPFSFTATVGYYVAIVLALRFASPAITALVVGIGPISIAFYGNWKERECSFKSLVIPSLLICAGLVLINAPHLIDNPAPGNFLFGVIAAFIALAFWTWYVVANSRFMKDHPQVASSEWSTMIGVGGLFWVVVFALLFGEGSTIEKLLLFDESVGRFVVGSIVLGLISGWLGTFFWNKAIFYLPVTLAGQLSLFETLFGLVFIYSLDQRLPPKLEVVGIALLLAAITVGIRASSQKAVSHA